MFLTHGLDIDCNELVELVTAYLDDALDPDTRRRFTDHLDLCDGCDTYVEQMRQTIRLTGALAADDLAPDLRETLLTAFRGWKNGTAPPA